MPLPLISIIIPTHNRCDRVACAIDSALAQSYGNIEVVVVDDGSTDTTTELLLNYSKRYSNFRAVRNETPLGACAARNRGLQEAKGVFVTGLDDDDFFPVERLERLYQIYREEYAFVCSRANRYTDRYFKNPSKLRSVFRKLRVYPLHEILFQNRVGSQILVTRARLLEVNGFDEKMKALQDYDLWVRLIEKFGPALATSEKLYNINKSDTYGRITNSRSRIVGLIQFYRKHRNKMSAAQKKNARANILLEQGKPITYHQLQSLLCWRVYRKIFKLVRLTMTS